MSESQDSYTITVHDVCGRPVVMTWEWKYYEWYCVICKKPFEEIDDELSDVPPTPKLEVDEKFLRLEYEKERKQRKYDGTR